MKQKEIFMQYIMNNRDQLQEDVRRLQQQVRYRKIDQIDCLELSLAIERLNAFEDFSRAAMAKSKYPEMWAELTAFLGITEDTRLSEYTHF